MLDMVQAVEMGEERMEKEIWESERKIWGWSRNRVSQNNDFKAISTHESNPTAYELNEWKMDGKRNLWIIR